MLVANRHIWEQLGLNSREALLMSSMVHITRRMQLDAYGKKPRLATLKDASPYISASFLGLQVERFYLYCLNQRGNLKERVFLHEGISNGTLVSLSKIMSEIVRIQPYAVIISHNHPGGTLRPSQDDINCTLEIMRMLSILGIPMLDHVIACQETPVSVRQLGFIPEAKWMQQSPDHRLLAHWLDNCEDFTENEYLF